jgi:phosphatidylglycerophosphate synthase
VRVPRSALLTPPNLLSLSRLLLAALFAAWPQASWRLLLVAVAGATDLLDGWLARRTNTTTRWGALIDPIADRVFVLVAVVAFVAEGVFSVSDALLFIARDLATAIGFLVARVVPWLRPVEFKARGPGKLVTALQLVTLVVALARPSLVPPLVAVIAVVSAVAIADYTVALWRARAR